ncbi:hypothetical protein BaRGS_00033912 [Batillaria attramentaria]|uniref:Ribonuclease P protein subunit p29 n=1 Tax=Batillaria attramentaria TaxID=370345 RepID=A0ABD0JJD0_9CAEN
MDVWVVQKLFSRPFTDTKGVRRKDMIKSFLKRHLPANRLLANEDDITHNYISLGNQPRRSKFSLAKKKQNKLTKRERKTNKLVDIPKEGQSFEQHLPLHQLWREYMEEVIPVSSLSSPGALQAASQRVLKADLHGCMLTVQRSRCPSYVGLCGIVLQETRNTFTLITKQGGVKCVPKLNSTFVFPLSGYLFTIHGNHFKVKAGERSSRKFKSKATIDL